MINLNDVDNDMMGNTQERIETNDDKFVYKL